MTALLTAAAITADTTMTTTDIIEMPLNCRCGRCEDRLIYVLRAEAEMCHGARTEMARRRSRIRRMKRSAYDRARYSQRRSA